jgi:tetratricopeptide (TPR) repeat protein
MLASALAALRAGRLEEAEEIGDRLCASTPDDPAAHQLAATIALWRGRLADAARWAHSCLALRPDHAPALIVAGRIARAANDLAQATAYFRRASQLSPDRAEPAFLTCVVLLEQGDAQARSMLDDLLRRFRGDAEGWREIGGALQRAGQFAGAALAFRRALSASPDLFDARVALGLCLRQNGEAALARLELERAVKAGGDGRAWFALGLVCEDLHDLPGAIGAYRRSAQLQPDAPETHVNLGLTLQRSGNLEAAMQSYRRAVRLRADSFGRIAQGLASARKGQLWLDLGRLRRSLGG